MGNTLLNEAAIAKMALKEFKNALSFTKGTDRQYDKEFRARKIGDTINVDKPQRYEVTDGAVLSVQDVEQETVPVVLDKRKHVGFQFSTQEATLNVRKFEELILKPAVTRLANQVDYDGLNRFQGVFNSVGTPGTQPNSEDTAYALAADARQKLMEFSAPKDDLKHVCLNPASENAIVKGLKGLFNSQPRVTEQYESGEMGKALGFSWRMDQNVNTHTTGSFGDGLDLNETVSANGVSALDVDGGTTGAGNVTGYLKKGDVITFAGVNAVNPITKQDTGELMQFVVTEDVTIDNAGAGEINISPAIYISGPKQNVASAPEDGDAISLFGAADNTYGSKSSPANLAYHKNAFTLACADLKIPQGVHQAYMARDPESGLGMRYICFYDGVNDILAHRLDVLYGWKEMYPEWACRMHG